MAKLTKGSKAASQQFQGKCTRRESDESSDETTGEESNMLSVDSDDNRQSSDGDSEEDWEPCTSSLPVNKRPHTEKQQDSSSGSWSEEESLPPAPKRGKATRSARSRGHGRGGRSHAAFSTSSPSEERWKDVDEADITPPQPVFTPINPPGPQLRDTASYTALQLFQLFFTNSILLTIVDNTNLYGATHNSTTSNRWMDLTLEDMYAFLSLVVYMGVVKCPSLSDYWRGDTLYSLPFPKRVMTRQRFCRVRGALHLSSPLADAANEQRKGTTAFDRLGNIKPLYDEIRDTCMRHYHPHQEIAIDERMVASKSSNGGLKVKQYVNNKHGYKLFVLADSTNGYTWDFFVYQGKSEGKSGKGVGYESVMELVDTRLLGTGYKLFVNNFYTSSLLFRHLLQKKIWACGSIHTRSVGFPRTQNNSLDSKSPRGSIRWIRKDPLLFVQWRDRGDVSLCSTIHTAHGEDTVQRKVKDAGGQWIVKDVPVSPAVKEYNRCIGAVDHSDALVRSYKVPHRTRKWYKTFFYHFVDIAIVNAFILHKELTEAKGEAPMPQKAFRETLALELSMVGSSSTARPDPPSPAPLPLGAHHRPVYISGSSTNGRRKCRQCQAKTPVKCSSCNMPLCFVAGRDCYNEWHDANTL